MSHSSDADSCDREQSLKNILEDISLRKRRPWNPDGDSIVSGDIDLLGDVDGLDEEEEGVGCPLPSTPEDNQLLEAEVSTFALLYFLYS